jgi:UrcA family protein
MTTFNIVSRRFATKTTVRCLGAVLLAVGVLGGAVVQADQSASELSSQQVKLADIDLSSAGGQRLAQARIQEVAHTLCSRVADELDLSHHDNYVKCVDLAVAKANVRLQALLNRQPAPALAQLKAIP